MGLFDRSSSSTTNLTENRDNRLVLDNQSQGISGDSNSLYVTTNATTTDHASVAQAIALGNGVVSGANESLRAALAVVDKGVSNALASNSVAMNGAFATAGNATRDALSANTKVSQDAIASILSANRDSLSFASGVNRDSLALASSGLTLAGTINRDSLELANRGQTLIANSAAESLGMVGSIVDKAFTLNDRNTKSALEASQNASNLVSRAYDTATGYQAEKQTADSKYLVIAGFIAVALVAIKAFS